MHVFTCLSEPKQKKMLRPSLRRQAAIATLLLGATAPVAVSAAASIPNLHVASAKLQGKAEFMRSMESSPAARKLRAAERARSNLRRKIAAAAVPAASVPSYTHSRRLEEGGQEEEDGVWDDFGFDVADFSLKYAGCSAVATYSDEFADNEEMDTVVQSKKFVVFRLCPTEYCSDDRTFGCSNNYGEYILDMEDYLMFMREYKEEQMQRYCEFCEECMNMEEEQNENEEGQEEQGENQEEGVGIDLSVPVFLIYYTFVIGYFTRRTYVFCCVFLTIAFTFVADQFLSKLYRLLG